MSTSTSIPIKLEFYANTVKSLEELMDYTVHDDVNQMFGEAFMYYELYERHVLKAKERGEKVDFAIVKDAGMGDESVHAYIISDDITDDHQFLGFLENLNCSPEPDDSPEIIFKQSQRLTKALILFEQIVLGRSQGLSPAIRIHDPIPGKGKTFLLDGMIQPRREIPKPSGPYLH